MLFNILLMKVKVVEVADVNDKFTLLFPVVY